ncbi:N-acetylglucosamine-1-phosphotransferase subunits alpha/beta-like isoform X2 [Vanacampus margaritifer]
MVLKLLHRLPCCLSHRYRIVAYCMGLIFMMLSLQLIVEFVEEWSSDRFHQFHEVSDMHKKVDNCTSFHSRECTPIPIDLVYTWVNGTDVAWLMDFMEAKEQLAKKQGVPRKPRCPLSQCIAAPMLVLEPALPASITTQELPLVLPSFSTAKSVLRLTKPLQPSDAVSVVVFHSQADAEKALTDTLNDHKFSIAECYLTTNKDAPGLFQMQTLAYLSGFSGSFNESQELRAKLPANITDKITALELYPEASIALLHLKTPQNLIDLLQEAQDKLKMDGKELAISPVYMFWDLSAIIKFFQIHTVHTKKETRDFLALNRFEDNGALLYSLRSVEKYVPWVRHVFIVTNGQIPSWLNLKNPRVSIVTHQEIFLNQSHLPTFSSPAIESNLHRILGISQKFIYLNDDVMFGKDVWLDDFYTPSDGQNVYLAWNVPACSKGCQADWIKNGHCDQACNNVACQWDGGDCKARNRRSIRSAGDGDFSQANKTQATRQRSRSTQKTQSLFLYQNEDKRDPKIQSEQHGRKLMTDMEVVGRTDPMGMTLHQMPSTKGFLLWKKEEDHLQRALTYETNGAAIGRKLQDAFVDSLRYVDRLYNQRFGRLARKVIAHAPHMIDKLVMQELQDTFPQEFQKTSSHHLRHGDDMQFAFSYFYFLMSIKQQASISEVFHTADKDHSGVLSDNEIQDLAMQIYKQQLKPEDLTRLKNQLINCSQSLPKEVSQIHRAKPSQKSQVTEELFMNCKPVTDRIRSTFADQKKYKYKALNSDEVHFKMIHNDLAEVEHIFDDIHRHPKKFVCINDDIDHTKSNAMGVKKKLMEFYQSMLPQPSQFELHKDMPNKFLHMDELRQWKALVLRKKLAELAEQRAQQAYQKKMRFYRYFAIVVLVIFAFKFFATKMAHLIRKLLCK